MSQYLQCDGPRGFLQASLLEPRSITSDFNFPKWSYYGHGSGHHASRYEYSLRRRKSA